jgi:hypothetical protein
VSNVKEVVSWGRKIQKEKKRVDGAALFPLVIGQ